MTLTEGQTLKDSRYTIKHTIHSSRNGVVYHAYDAQPDHDHDHDVAIKEIPNVTSPEFVQALKEKAKELSELDYTTCPALPKVRDYYTEGGNFYLVMDYAGGESAREYCERQPETHLDAKDALNIIEPVIKALKCLHNQTSSIIHGNINPENIRINPNDKSVRLVGLGYHLRRIFLDPQATSHDFFPLEQYGGENNLDVRSDIYSLGATIYYLLTGNSSVVNANARVQVVVQHKPDPLPHWKSRTKRCLRSLTRWCARCLLSPRRAVMRMLRNFKKSYRKVCKCIRLILFNPGQWSVWIGLLEGKRKLGRFSNC